MKFLAIDVETANADYSSICQIGIAEFDGGEVIDTWSTLVNPESHFDPFNVSIHGIGETDVINSATFHDIYDQVKEKISDRITVHHMPFDRVAVNRACNGCKLNNIKAQWLDSAKIVRRTWNQFSKRGYGLSNISNFLGIDFEHHDALEDAITAGKIVNEACQIKKLSVREWLREVERPITKPASKISKLPSVKANPEGELYGECVVFTGSLKSMPRKEAMKIAAKAGCEIKNTMSKKISMLIVGVQDEYKLAGYKKSIKHRQAEKLISQGHELKILSEHDFLEMCNNGN